MSLLLSGSAITARSLLSSIPDFPPHLLISPNKYLTLFVRIGYSTSEVQSLKILLGLRDIQSARHFALTLGKLGEWLVTAKYFLVVRFHQRGKLLLGNEKVAFFAFTLHVRIARFGNEPLNTTLFTPTWVLLNADHLLWRLTCRKKQDEMCHRRRENLLFNDHS